MISVIIPVYNEETVIDRALTSLPYHEEIEVIVVDGQSEDRTKILAEKYPVRIVTSARGRAVQMNTGASVAGGDILLFMHADCVLEAGGLKALRVCLSKGFLGGCFKHSIDSPKWIYRCIENSGHYRAKLFRTFYGDQAIFVRRDVFERIGGFDTMPLFEDAAFSQKMKRIGPTSVLEHKAIVLPRRWEKEGIIKTTLLNWLLAVGFILGVPTDKLARLYKNIR